MRKITLWNSLYFPTICFVVLKSYVRWCEGPMLQCQLMFFKLSTVLKFKLSIPQLINPILVYQSLTHAAPQFLSKLFPSLYCSVSPYTSSQPITSWVYQWLLYLLTNQITHQGFLIFNWVKLLITWLRRWPLHRLSKHQSPTTVCYSSVQTILILFVLIVTIEVQPNEVLL